MGWHARLGVSVAADLALMRVPWREGGGGGGAGGSGSSEGGGDFEADKAGSWRLVAGGLDGGSVRCCDAIVRVELLRERFDGVEAARS